MQDQNGLGLLFLFMLIRHSREIAIAAVLASAAALVWGLVWMLK
jgi:hypothetical protein